MQEIWKPIPNTDNYYVSNLGNIKRESGELIDFYEHAEGYYRCTVDGIRDYVHRFVAKAFCENDDPTNKTFVDHIDGNKKNNVATNLRWVTPHENNIYAAELGLYNNKYEKANTPIIAYNNKTNELKIFASQCTMSEELGIPDCGINKVVKNIRNTTHGWNVDYFNGENLTNYLNKVSNVSNIKNSITTNTNITNNCFELFCILLRILCCNKDIRGFEDYVNEFLNIILRIKRKEIVVTSNN